ncbi:putative ATPase/DNA-binding XRE family transcriptional regulator [Actinoplanes tereljensis]|uniref:HTH cro/C1-type domain-containing protein n=1 Tax=Paractinoplanes tereljensis TaxID=571912 RepID=A0A919TRV6_9ACTN|nr:tetratricopeptide repeat protein [Actinoplanes tereljensis]GIF20718.1 hypothetical protein Ate02nite_34480 [Actinoplanes tereljensis]
MTDSFAGVLRAFRIRANLTQEELGHRAEISTRGVSDLERGITLNPRTATIHRLADALRLPDPDRSALLGAARNSVTKPAAVPGEPTPLFGRQDEIAEATTVLRDPARRLVTLTGRGGVGKTRLAVEIARAWSDPVGFAPLADLQDPQLVVPAVAESLRLRSAGADGIRAWAAGAPALLVLDNFEHLMSAAPVVSDLVASCPTLRVLITSQAPLRLRGETELRLNALEPALAMEVFLHRAGVVAPRWSPDDDERVIVADLCRAVEGLPLALELAAGWVRIVSPRELVGRPVLRLLDRGDRDAPERQRSLTGALAYSVALLTPDAATFLRRLAVFAGGWNLARAEEICAVDDALGGTAELVEAGLVTPVDGNRFTMPALVREFAGAQPEAAVEQRHTEVFAELVARLAAELTGPRQQEALRELDTEHRNIQEVLERCLRTGRASTAHEMAGQLWRFWEIRGHLVAGRRWLDRVLGPDQDQDQIPATVRAGALKAAGNLARDQGDFEAARRFHEDALTLFDRAGDTLGTASALNNLGNVALDAGEWNRAVTRFRGSLAAFEAGGDAYNTALLRNNLALALRTIGALDEAMDLLDRSIAGFRTLGDDRGTARALESRARVLDLAGRHAEADPLHRESLSLRLTVGDLGGVVRSLEGLAHCRARLGQARMAARLLGHAEAIRQRIDEPRSADDRLVVEPALAAVAAQLSPADAAEASRSGRAATTAQITAELE